MNFAYAVLGAFALSSILVLLQIEVFHKFHLGQSIREDGPKAHQIKKGTPTMGGLAILIAATIVFLAFQKWDSTSLLIIFLLLGMGFLGGWDDALILVRGKNQGLYPRQKFLGQIFLAVLFSGTFLYLFSSQNLAVSTEIFYSGMLFIFYIFLIVGSSNAVNLTDGLDGLAAGLLLIVLLFFQILLGSSSHLSLLLLNSSLIGALLGFLIFNWHPAKIFMGDLGSLSLGAYIAGMAIALQIEFLLAMVAAVFVLETLSVMLQVFWFKKFGKRIFKMSPLHHHFELSGWSEKKVVLSFWAAGIFFAFLAYGIHKLFLV